MISIGVFLILASVALGLMVFAAIAGSPTGGDTGKMLTLWACAAALIVGIAMTFVGALLAIAN